MPLTLLDHAPSTGPRPQALLDHAPSTGPRHAELRKRGCWRSKSLVAAPPVAGAQPRDLRAARLVVGHAAPVRVRALSVHAAHLGPRARLWRQDGARVLLRHGDAVLARRALARGGGGGGGGGAGGGDALAALPVVGADARHRRGAGQRQRLAAPVRHVLAPPVSAARLAEVGAQARDGGGARRGEGDAVPSSRPAQGVAAAALEGRADPGGRGLAGQGQRGARLRARAVRAAPPTHGADSGRRARAAVRVRDALPAGVAAEVVAAADVVAGTHPGDGGGAALRQPHAGPARRGLAQPVSAAPEGARAQAVHFRGAGERARNAHLARRVFTQVVGAALEARGAHLRRRVAAEVEAGDALLACNG